MIKKLALVILLACSTSLSAQTVDSTGNLIDPNKWTNVIYMTPEQLAQVEGAGGGPLPAFNTGTNTIRFSFMPYTASQIIAINTALSGQGISVGGFNYSWKIYNDLENCCSTRGSLVGTVNFANNSGKILESYTYDYSLTNTGATFQTFSGTETFSSPYQLNSLGYVGIAWTGSDINFWSGYYGPRVRDTSISLNYTVTQPSSPTPTTTTATTNTAVIDAIAQATAPVTEPVTTTTTASTTTPVVESTTTTAPTTAQTSSSSSVASITPITNTATSTSSSSTTQSSAPSLSSIMSMIQSNQARENNIAMSAVAQSNEVAQTAVAQAEKTALDVASNSLSQSLDVARDSAKIDNKDNRTNTNSSLALLSNSPLPFQANSSIVQQSQLLSNQLSISVNPFNNQQQQQQNNNNIPTISTVQELAQPQEIKLSSTNNTLSQQVETPNNSMSLFAKRGDPLTDYIEQNNILVAMAQPEMKQSTVKKDVQDNDLAGIVRIERMAVTPVGFNVYSLALRDVSFYEPKEIYKNVVIKDNVRTMYFIEKGNTDTYNKMIEGQYK